MFLIHFTYSMFITLMHSNKFYRGTTYLTPIWISFRLEIDFHNKQTSLKANTKETISNKT